MSITAITIENFKAIKEPVRIELQPITLLFGPNSAGKSTIVQALHYAREIFERQNLNPDRTLLGGETIDLGGFESLVYGHNLNLPIRFKFELDLSHEDLPHYIEGYEDLGLIDWQQSDLWDIPTRAQSAWVQIEVRWNALLGRPLLTSYQVGINEFDLAKITATDDGKQIALQDINPFNPVFLNQASPKEASENAIKLIKGEISDDTDMGCILMPLLHLFNISEGVVGITKGMMLKGQESPLPNCGVTLKFSDNLWSEESGFEDQGSIVQLFSSLITGPGELIRDGLRKLCYVGPLREVPKRNHKPSTSPDESRWSNGLAAYDTLFFAEDAFIAEVNEWMTQEERLATGYSVKVKKYRELETDSPLSLAIMNDRLLDEDIDFKGALLTLTEKRRLLIRDEARNIELAPQDIGVGISQVLPVVVAALHRKIGFVMIEQPELHIHPAIQVALGDLFIEQVRKASDLTFILKTHSEHLMLRLLRRIRETGEKTVPEDKSLKPEELSIYFIEQGNEGISCHSIRVDQEGDFIDRWPKGFFTERAEELF